MVSYNVKIDAYYGTTSRGTSALTIIKNELLTARLGFDENIVMNSGPVAAPSYCLE